MMPNRPVPADTLAAPAPSSASGWRGTLMMLSLGLYASCTGAVEGGLTGGPSGDISGPMVKPGTGSPDTTGTAGTGTKPPGTGVVLPPVVDSKVCKDTAPFSSPIRRLTRSEYDATIIALLGDASKPSRDFAVETGLTGFDTAVDAVVVNDGIASQYVEASKGLAKKAVANMPTLLGCDVTAKSEDVCARDFIGRFGRRAFRRPLLADEQQRFEMFYSTSKASYGFAPAIEMVLRTFLMSPSFLYRVEIGAGVDTQTKQTRLTAYEMATRLSYFLWGTMPDDELFAAAEKGALAQPAQVLAQAQRMISHVNGGRVFRDFYSQWIKLDRLESMSRGAVFTPALAASMREETTTFFDRMIRERGATWPELMTSPTSYVNADVAAVYGLSGVTGPAFREVTRQADRHRGFLTQPSLMTLLSDTGNSASAIHRGVFMRKHIMCVPVPPPPVGIDPKIPAENATLTSRQQLENKTQTVDPCQVCHKMINPPGYAFGKFDQIGRFRDNDAAGRPIDTTGNLIGTDVDGAFSGHSELIDKLARSPGAQVCAVTEWFRYSMARTESDDDDCRVKQLVDAFSASKGSVTALLSKIVTSNAFMFKEMQ